MSLVTLNEGRTFEKQDVYWAIVVQFGHDPNQMSRIENAHTMTNGGFIWRVIYKLSLFSGVLLRTKSGKRRPSRSRLGTFHGRRSTGPSLFSSTRVAGQVGESSLVSRRSAQTGTKRQRFETEEKEFWHRRLSGDLGATLQTTFRPNWGEFNIIDKFLLWRIVLRCLRKSIL